MTANEAKTWNETKPIGGRDSAGLPLKYMRPISIAGVGKTAFGAFPERGLQDLASEAIGAALADSGLAAVDIEAFVYQRGGGGAEAAATHADGEHFEVAGEDDVGGGEGGAMPAEQCHFTQDRPQALGEATVVGLPEIDGGAACYGGDWSRATAETGESDGCAAVAKHGDAASHCGVGEVVHQIEDF